MTPERCTYHTRPAPEDGSPLRCVLAADHPGEHRISVADDLPTQAERERCPTCGTDDREDRFAMLERHLAYDAGISGCPDDFHDTASPAQPTGPEKGGGEVEIVKFFPNNPPDKGEIVLLKGGGRMRVRKVEVEWEGLDWTLKRLDLEAVDA